MDTVAAPANTIELTTSVRVDSAATPLTEVARRIESALLTAAHEGGIVTLKQYFVRPRNGEIQIGLRFVGIDPDHVEGAANDLLEMALDSGLQSGDPCQTPPQRTNTLLLGV